MRYIDADALKHRLELVSVDAITLYEMGINAGLHRAEAEVELLPTADVVEIVRCKDCLYYSHEKGYCYTHGIGVIGESYCSFGERREK